MQHYQVVTAKTVAKLDSFDRADVMRMAHKITRQVVGGSGSKLVSYPATLKAVLCDLYKYLTISEKSGLAFANMHYLCYKVQDADKALDRGDINQASMDLAFSLNYVTNMYKSETFATLRDAIRDMYHAFSVGTWDRFNATVKEKLC